MKIKSKKIETIYKSLKNNDFAEKDLNIMSSFDEEDLSELIVLIDLNIIPIDILKYYFVVYDEEVILNLEKKIGHESVNYYLTKCWIDCISNDSDENIISSLIGNSLFTSDLISRIRKGFLLEFHLIDFFENKLESLVRHYHLQKQKNSLFFSLTGVDIADNNVDNIENDFLETYHSISQQIEVSVLIYDYFDIFNNSFRYNDYLIKSSLEAKDIAKNEIIKKVKNHLNNKTKVDYMNNQQLNFYKTINTNKLIKNEFLDKEFGDPRLGVDIDDLELEEPKIVTEKISFFNKKSTNFISDQELKAIYNNKSIRSIKEKSNNRYYKIFVILMCLIGFGGYVGILLSKSEARETENKAVVSIIKEEKNNNEIINNDK